MNRIAIIVPAFNEEATIAGIINQINNLNLSTNNKYTCIVINDGSTDQTGFIAKKLNCILRTHNSNRGKGFALYTGMWYSNKERFDYIVQIDADGQHKIIEIPVLIDKLIKTKADVVIGSRFLQKNGFKPSLYRKVGIIFFNYLTMILINRKISDATNGFRVLNRRALKTILFESPARYTEVLSILQYKKHNLHFIEHPVTVQKRLAGKSAFNMYTSISYMIFVTLNALQYHIKNSRYV